MNGPWGTKVWAVMVSYRTPRLTPRTARLFRETVPETPLLVVDNDPDTHRYRLMREELASLDVHVMRLPLPHSTHARAIEPAVAWLNSWEVRYMLHIEPDCDFEGRAWYDALVDGIGDGLMAGSDLLFDGTVHLTPSLWSVPYVARKGWRCVTTNVTPEEIEAVGLNFEPGPHLWDCARHAWFLAAKEGKAALVKTPGFTHRWMGWRFDPYLL